MTQAYAIGATDELVMLALLRYGPLYGVQIANYVNDASDGERFINPGTLYPMLKKLQSDGLIKGYQEPGKPIKERAGRPRKYYDLTEEGRFSLVAAEQTRRQLLGGEFGWLSC